MTQIRSFVPPPKDDSEEKHILKAIYGEIQSIRFVVQEWFALWKKVVVSTVVRFEITQLEDGKMKVTKFKTVITSLIGIAPGATGTFVAIPVDANGNQDMLPAGIIPTWVSSDPTNAPVVPSADGLSASVSLSPSATPGTPFTLTVSAPLPDGSTPTSGPESIPVLSLEVKSFVLNQTS